MEKIWSLINFITLARFQRDKPFRKPSFGGSSIYYLLLSIILLSALSASSCSAEVISPTSTPTIPSSTNTPAFSTPTIANPKGSIENPIIILQMTEENPQPLRDAGVEMVNFLQQETGLIIEYQVSDDAEAAFRQMRNNEVDFVWLQPLTYLAAYERDLIDPIFVSNHFGLYKYGTQFLANKSSGFIQYFDSATNKNTTTEEFALTQFEGKRPCWTEPSSLSGTIVPFGILAKNGIQILPPTYTQSHAATVRALYIKGICDFGAVFAYSGDPRTSSAVINDLPDAMDQIIVIWRTEPVIPSLSFNSSRNISESLRDQLTSAMIKLSQAENGNDILTRSLGYDIQGLISIDNGYFDQLRDLVHAANIEPFQHLGY